MPSERQRSVLIPTAAFAARHHQLRFSGERSYGYLDLDDWNALSPEDQERIQSHSVKLFKHFRFTKCLLHLLGVFPFSAKKLEDGSYTFNLHYCSTSYILFVIMTVLICGMFILFTSGFIIIFTDSHLSEEYHDRCGKTWGSTVISRNLPGIVFVWAHLLVICAACVFMITHTSSFLGFYNVVNEAVMQMDADATSGLLISELQSSIIFFILMLILVLTFAVGDYGPLEEIASFVTQATFYFAKPSMFYAGAENPFTAKDFVNLASKCRRECKDCYNAKKDAEMCRSNSCYNYLNTETLEFCAVKWAGFLIITYTLIAARTILRQFEFFCQVLVNLSSIWNKRFLNYASRDNSIKMDDPYRRRIIDHLMLKDHYQIVKLYEVAEDNFSLILFFYYASVFFCLICELYYTALLATQVTCATAVNRERDVAKAGKCHVDTDKGIDINKEVLELGLGDYGEGNEIVSFEDACSKSLKEIIAQSSMANLTLLVITMLSFVMTTLQADRASHQADIGFYRVRRRGYISCRTKKERNVMHALVFSFTGPKPFAITAAGFFLIRKKTIIVLSSVAFIYFLIILGFKPGMVASNVRCYKEIMVGSRTERVYLVKYPGII